MIHPTAIVHPGAKLGENVSIGPYSIIGEHVEIGDGTRVGPHVVIEGHTRIGRDNEIFQFCSLGAKPQDKKYDDALRAAVDNVTSSVARNGGRQAAAGHPAVLSHQKEKPPGEQAHEEHQPGKPVKGSGYEACDDACGSSGHSCRGQGSRPALG